MYSLADTARILDVSPSRLRYWERTELLKPSARDGGRPTFDFQDLVSIRSLLGLMERGLSLRRIRRSVVDLRQQLPELERPLGALRVWGESSRRVVVRHEGALIEADGQLLLEFEDVAQESVASLECQPSPAHSRSPLEWFERGCQLDSQSDGIDEAIDAYRYALELEPAFGDAHCNLGTIYFNRGDREQAAEHYEAALRIDPAHLEANFNLGNLHEEQGRREAALHLYKAACRSDPLFPDAQLNLALLYERLDLPGRAKEHWRRYLQLLPEGNWADVARKRLAE